MSHSKRNTSLAFFTSHERALLKATWGSQATRLSRDSFLPFASCRLCLQIARDPVACASNGDIFCRECAVSNLLAQRKEIKRLQKEDERRRREEAENERERGEEEKGKAVEDFERVMMGLEGGVKKKTNGDPVSREEEGVKEGRGVKRKFELDEDELLRNAKEERARARKALDEEKASKPTLPSFWVPSLTPSSTNTHTSSTTKPPKLHPICPSSSETSPHPLSLKTLVPVTFTTSSSTGSNVSSKPSPSDPPPSRICPSCKKALSNGLKAMLTIPCGHVICKPCVGKFMTPAKAPSNPPSDYQEETIACYVCSTSLSPMPTASKKHISAREGKDGAKNEKEALKPGMVEISADGTGFAGGGKNMAKREGVAFQC
ncbi:MAG: hypothetical protein Q9187_002896 [Circinaria calcarea]